MSSPKRIFVSEKLFPVPANYVNCKIEALGQQVKDLILKQDQMLARQEELAKMLAETNVLLRRSLGFLDNDLLAWFPLTEERGLHALEIELNSEKRDDLQATMKKLLGGNIAHLDRILDKSIVLSYNVDGTKGKQKLKMFPLFLKALQEATMREGHSTLFESELRKSLKVLKNRFHKQRARMVQSENRDVTLPESPLEHLTNSLFIP